VFSYGRRTPVEDPAVGLCLGPYGGPRGVGVSYERGTPVEFALTLFWGRRGTRSLPPHASPCPGQQLSRDVPQGYLSHKKTPTPLGPYSSPVPRVLGGS